MLGSMIGIFVKLLNTLSFAYIQVLDCLLEKISCIDKAKDANMFGATNKRNRACKEQQVSNKRIYLQIPTLTFLVSLSYYKQKSSIVLDHLLKYSFLVGKCLNH